MNFTRIFTIITLIILVFTSYMYFNTNSNIDKIQKNTQQLQSDENKKYLEYCDG